MLLCVLFVILVVALIANWALSHYDPEIKSRSASAEMRIKAVASAGTELAASLPMTGAGAPSAQTDDGPAVTIFRGGTLPTIVPGSPGAASETAGVTIFAGTRIVVVPPSQQIAALSGAAPAVGAGAGMIGGTIALPILGGGD